jgi:hypothetical protein
MAQSRSNFAWFACLELRMEKLQEVADNSSVCMEYVALQFGYNQKLFGLM